MNGDNFYLNMQNFSKKVDCFVANGLYTPKKNGIINEYRLYVANLFNIYSAPKQENLDKLIDYAKKNFKFGSVKIYNKICCSWLIFTNLAAQML